MTIARIRRIAFATALALAAVVALGSSPARAQSAEAETLFREGKRLLKEGEISQACDKFQASDRLEPSVGTKLNLADCRERNGQLATAWSLFLKAASAAKRADKDGKREAEAKRRAAALEPRLVHLTILVPDDSRVDNLSIRRNGVDVDEELWNERVPVDPGAHEISVEAPGYEKWSRTVEVKGKAKSVDVPKLAAVSPGAGAVAGGARLPPPEPPAPRPSSFTGLRKVAVALAVVGAGGVGAGAYFGTRSRSQARDSDAICPERVCGSPEAIELNESARRNARIANVAYIGGGAVLAGAVVLWFVGGPSARAERTALTPVISADQVGVSLGGRF